MAACSSIDPVSTSAHLTEGYCILFCCFLVWAARAASNAVPAPMVRFIMAAESSIDQVSATAHPKPPVYHAIACNLRFSSVAQNDVNDLNTGIWFANAILLAYTITPSGNQAES